MDINKKEPTYKKTAIYTCLFGGYDHLLLPKSSIKEEADFFCFTDTNIHSDLFKTINTLPQSSSPVVNSRFPKINSHIVLPDYDFTIYLDANLLLIANSLENFLSLMLKDASIGRFRHNSRNCIYKEAEVIMKRGLAPHGQVMNMINRYKAEGFPENYGLGANSVIFRDQRDPSVAKFNEAWWAEFLNGPKRDQLSFDYVKWKTGQKTFEYPALWSDNSFVVRISHSHPANHKDMSVISPKRNLFFKTLARIAKRVKKKSPQKVKNDTIQSINVLKAPTPSIRKKQYNKYWSNSILTLPSNFYPNPLIIDCGAGIGAASARLLSEHPSASLIAFEADHERFSCLKENIRSFGFEERAEIYEKACWIEEKDALEWYSINGIGSLSKPNSIGHSPGCVKTVKLKDYLTQPVFFLKMSIEGKEKEVLIDCEDKLKNIENMLIEFHYRVGEEDNLPDFINILKAHNFKTTIHHFEELNNRPFHHHDTKGEYYSKLFIAARQINPKF